MKSRMLLSIAGLFVLGLVVSQGLTIRTVKSSVTVWLLGSGSGCMVSTDFVNQQKWLPCEDVPRHLRGTLHLPSGEYIAIAAPPTATKTDRLTTNAFMETACGDGSRRDPSSSRSGSRRRYSEPRRILRAR
jgi:hypothetical protein